MEWLINKKGKRKLVIYFKSISYGIQMEVSPGSVEKVAVADTVLNHNALFFKMFFKLIGVYLERKNKLA